MSRLSTRRPTRQFTSYHCRLAIVLAVPLTATCLFAMPIAASRMAAPEAATTQVERTVLPERPRRLGEVPVEEANPQDPPHQAPTWQQAKAGSNGAVCPARVQVALARPIAHDTAPLDFHLPQSPQPACRAGRAPPAGVSIGC